MKLALTVLSNLIEHGLTDKPFQEFDVSKLPETALLSILVKWWMIQRTCRSKASSDSWLRCAARTHANGDKTFVTYERPAKATEGRLRGLASLAFGGHVEPEDEDTDALNHQIRLTT